MLFNSFGYILFLPIVFILYWFVFKSVKLQNLFIVVVSYVFYGWWDWRFLLLIATTTLISYVSGLTLLKYSRHGRFIVIANIFINLAILCVFKYYDFFIENFNILFQQLGIGLQANTLNLILPVGISFYTFQALSYTIDVYKQKIQPTRDAVAFFAFISFFPQLVAGPIERATNLLPQFSTRRKFDYFQGADGIRQMLWGFFKKMVIADNCALIVNNVFSDYTHYSSGMLLVGALAFTLQIYGDFSGYSDIAIGTAKLFGIKLMQNFNCPYFSRDIAEFWRKWHISLTTWFRDYIYIPLGGSRCSKPKVIRNTVIIFLISGLWHGANWTFICWGLYHALLFMPLLLLKVNRKNTTVVADGKIFPSFKEVAQIVFTFCLVVIGWIIFRAENIHQAYIYIVRLFTGSGNANLYSGGGMEPELLISILLLLVVEWINRGKSHPLDVVSWKPVSRRLLYVVVICFIFFFSANGSDFIYFQF